MRIKWNSQTVIAFIGTALQIIIYLREKDTVEFASSGASFLYIISALISGSGAYILSKKPILGTILLLTSSMLTMVTLLSVFPLLIFFMACIITLMKERQRLLMHK